MRKIPQFQHSDVKWVKKFWGRTRTLVSSTFYSLHELELRANSHCSLHYHEHRANIFRVISGLVEVVEFYGPKVNRIMLGPDNVHTVPSLVPHFFSVYKDGLIYEEYFPDRDGVVQANDIVRLVEGGIDTDLLNLPTKLFNLYRSSQ